jgi:hypothetical protein
VCGWQPRRYAALRDGQVLHDVARLASIRARRAAVARDVRSAGTGAISTDILEFRGRVLVIQASSGGNGRAALISDTVCPSPRATARSACPGQSPPDARARGFRWSAVGDQAAASMDGHVPQAADRLASARARRAAAARAVRSAGTASPLPKYISSGVCPRNAECGSTPLCSWT